MILERIRELLVEQLNLDYEHLQALSLIHIWEAMGICCR